MSHSGAAAPVTGGCAVAVGMQQMKRNGVAFATFTGTVEADKFVGDGSGLTNLPLPTASNIDASKIASGTLADARLSSNVALKNTAATADFVGAVSGKYFTGPAGLPRFPTAGAATIRAGRSKVRVSNQAVSASAVVLAVLQSDPGKAVSIRHIAKGAGFFDVFLTGAVAAKTAVGYMIVGKP